jgi:hypothetical protein
MNLKNYYLDLTAVRNLTDDQERKQIHDYYRDLLIDERTNVITSIFNTLYKGGFLKEVREEKISELLNE